MRIGQHETHPAADAFPLMDDTALQNLADDIRCNGLRRPIVLLAVTPTDARVLDGRNRYLACELAEVEPRFRYYDGPQDPDDLARYVCSENLARRDLTPAARALCARRLIALIRVRKARDKYQRALPGVAEADPAADIVLDDGTPELVAAVEAGDVPLDLAAEIAKHEPDKQRGMLEKLKAEPAIRPRLDRLMSITMELTPADVAAIKAGLVVLEQSKHGVVRAAAGLVRKMAGLS
jgi:ParB-like chromosome segregation protein Spo0J